VEATMAHRKFDDVATKHMVVVWIYISGTHYQRVNHQTSPSVSNPHEFTIKITMNSPLKKARLDEIPLNPQQKLNP